MKSILKKEKWLEREECLRSVIVAKAVDGHLGRVFDAGKRKSVVQTVLIYPVHSVILPQESLKVV